MLPLQSLLDLLAVLNRFNALSASFSCRPHAPLRTQAVTQCRKWVQETHAHNIAAISAALTSETWAPLGSAASLQRVVDGLAARSAGLQSGDQNGDRNADRDVRKDGDGDADGGAERRAAGNGVPRGGGGEAGTAEVEGGAGGVFRSDGWSGEGAKGVSGGGVGRETGRGLGSGGREDGGGSGGMGHGGGEGGKEEGRGTVKGSGSVVVDGEAYVVVGSVEALLVAVKEYVDAAQALGDLQREISHRCVSRYLTCGGEDIAHEGGRRGRVGCGKAGKPGRGRKSSLCS